LSRAFVFASDRLRRLAAAGRPAIAVALAALAAFATAQVAPGTDASRVLLPAVGLRARDIAVVVNDADPASVEVGRYYASKRGIAALKFRKIEIQESFTTFEDQPKFDSVRPELGAAVQRELRGCPVTRMQGIDRASVCSSCHVPHYKLD